jgi:hypothetical protein
MRNRDFSQYIDFSVIKKHQVDQPSLRFMKYLFLAFQAHPEQQHLTRLTAGGRDSVAAAATGWTPAGEPVPGRGKML